MNKDNLETIFNDDLGTSFFPLLAEEYLKDHDYDRALQVLDIGLLLNPNNNDGKYIKAKIAMIHSDTTTAVTLLKEILDADELYINAMKMLVLHYQSTGKNQASMIKILEQILDLLPGDEFATGVMKSIKNLKKKSSAKVKSVPKKKAATKGATKKKATKKVKQSSGKPKAQSQKAKKSKISPKMATLTFVDILIKQKQYTQASNVLKIVDKNKSISRASITQRQEKIKKGLSKED